METTNNIPIFSQRHIDNSNLPFNTAPPNKSQPINNTYVSYNHTPQKRNNLNSQMYLNSSGKETKGLRQEGEYMIKQANKNIRPGMQQNSHSLSNKKSQQQIAMANGRLPKVDLNHGTWGNKNAMDKHSPMVKINGG